MSKSIILKDKEMREEFVGVFNKWIQEVPAFMLTPILENLLNSARQIADAQIQQELEKESEVTDDGNITEGTESD
jgi:hypothetical protein